MKHLNLLTLLSAGIIISQLGTALAADGKGNGGVAVVCRDKSGKITSAEILDLFEGRNQFGLNYSANTNDPDTLVDLAQLKMIGNADFLGQFRKVLSDVRAGLVFLPRGIGLTPTDDAFPTIQKKDCQFEQLANYKDDDSKIYIDEEIYSQLSKVDQAGLLVHEAIYKIARVNLGDESSVRSRKFTSQVLASNANLGVIDSLMATIGKKPKPKPVNRLQSGTYVTDSKSCYLKLYVNGDKLTTVEIPNPKIKAEYCSGYTLTYNWTKITLEDGKVIEAYARPPQKYIRDDTIEVMDDHTFSRWYSYAIYYLAKPRAE